MMLFQVDVENFREVMILNCSCQQDFQRIAQQRHRVMISHERRILLKDVAGFRILDV